MFELCSHGHKGVLGDRGEWSKAAPAQDEWAPYCTTDGHFGRIDLQNEINLLAACGAIVGA